MQAPTSAAELTESKRAIEAILLVSSDPTPSQQLAQLLELPHEIVVELCRDLAAAYEVANHGFQLVEVAGGWRYQTHPDLASYVERFAMDGQSTRLSSAALETMAIVAYKQPISRAQISAIRGVNVDAVLRTLVQRGYVEEIGRDTGAGQAVLFGTTSYFLERLGLNTLGDLPALGEFVPSAEVVEALEQTLKVELDIDPDLATDDGERAATTEAADPAPAVIDLRDPEPERDRESELEPELESAAESEPQSGSGPEPAVDVIDLSGTEPPVPWSHRAE
ncbi:MAG: SMC-Scp complex subunit ScpB [Acidimicrobiales bacterium]